LRLNLMPFGSGTIVRSTPRAVPATVPDPFLNQAEKAANRCYSIVTLFSRLARDLACQGTFVINAVTIPRPHGLIDY
jgi:hypothetical protein